MLRTSPKPSCGGCIFHTGLRVTAFHTLTVESAEAVMSQLFLPSCTHSNASTLRVCPTRSACTLRLLECHTRICPEGSPAKMYLSLCARHSALLSGRVSDEIGLWDSAHKYERNAVISSESRLLLHSALEPDSSAEKVRHTRGFGGHGCILHLRANRGKPHTLQSTGAKPCCLRYCNRALA